MRLGTLVYAVVFGAGTLGSTVEAGVRTDQLRVSQTASVTATCGEEQVPQHRPRR